eukprot:1222092-Rhodomonas_salina.2
MSPEPSSPSPWLWSTSSETSCDGRQPANCFAPSTPILVWHNERQRNARKPDNFTMASTPLSPTSVAVRSIMTGEGVRPRAELTPSMHHGSTPLPDSSSRAPSHANALNRRGLSTGHSARRGRAVMALTPQLLAGGEKNPRYSVSPGGCGASSADAGASSVGVRSTQV